MGRRAIIIDDEHHARENLQMLIEEYCPSIEVLGQGHDVASGLAAIQEFDPEVIFLDIRMPSGSEGFELLKQIQDPNFLVVFVTAFKDYAMDAFKVNAVDYILKPIDIDELIETVNRLEIRLRSFKEFKEKASQYKSNLERLSEEMMMKSRRMTISHSTGIKLVRIEEIISLRAESNCTRLTFKGGSQYLDTRTLKHYESELRMNGFYRVHRSYMINLNELEEIDRNEGNYAVLSNGTKIPISRKAMSGLLDRMKSI